MALTKSIGGISGGGGSLAVQEEGVTTTASASTLNFVGPGVTATDVGGVATVTVPGYTAPAWVTNHPDTPPSSPTLFSGVAYDIEFVRDVTLSGHTVLGSPATTPSIVDRALRIVGGTSASADVKGVQWTAPAAPYTMTAKVRRKLTSGSFGNFGIALRTGGTAHTAIVCNQNGGYTSGQVGWDDYTALTTRSAFGANANYPVWWPIYLRLTNDGTNISYLVSTTGHPDSFVAIATRTIATALGGVAPTKFAVTMDTFGGTALTGYCEWIRFT